MTFTTYQPQVTLFMKPTTALKGFPMDPMPGNAIDPPPKEQQ
jgi:hypothetical protein